MVRAAPEIENSAVAAAFEKFSPDVRADLMASQALIFEVSAARPETGRLEETLKWGQPSYLIPETKSGSTLRLGQTKGGKPAIFAHCQTSIIGDFRALFPDDYVYDGNRGVEIYMAALDRKKLHLLIASALTYHRCD